MSRGIPVVNRSVDSNNRAVSANLAVPKPEAGLIHHWDWSNNNTTLTKVPDLQGSADLTGEMENLSGSLNGLQVGYLDNTRDYTNTNYNLNVQFGSPISGTHWIFVVLARRVPLNGKNHIHIENYNGQSNSDYRFYSDTSGQWRVQQANEINGGTSVDDEYDIIGMRKDTRDISQGGDEILRENGNRLVRTNNGNASLDGLILNPYDSGVDFGEMMIYDFRTSGFSVSDVENYLSYKWGIDLV
jgi:hypothetical protein